LLHVRRSSCVRSPRSRAALTRRCRASWRIDTKYYTADVELAVRALSLLRACAAHARGARESAYALRNRRGFWRSLSQVLELPRDVAAAPAVLQRDAEAVVLAYDAAEARAQRLPLCACAFCRRAHAFARCAR
jgi:hypothetical protein